MPLKLRELRFTAWILVTCLIFYSIEWALLTVAVNLPMPIDLMGSSRSRYYTTLFLSIPATYIFARLSLVFPATALNKKTGLKWSWEKTCQNGWRMVVIVGLYPWLISNIIWLFSRSQSTPFEQTLVALLYYAGSALGVFALSLTYKEIIDEAGVLSA